MKLSNTTESLQPSATLQIAGKAAKYRAAGKDIIDFSAGQPDFSSPLIAKEAGIQAIQQNQTGYTANPGIPELRDAIAAKTNQEQNSDFTPEQVLVSPGAKASLFFALQALLNPGERVVILAPYWVSYPKQIELAGGVVEVVHTSAEDGFVPDLESLRKAMQGTRAVILNDPCNPTGSAFSEASLKAVGQVLLESGACIILDEIYGSLRFDGRGHGGLLRLMPELKDRTLIVDGVSKAFSMTGWRIGWALGPSDWIQGMARWQSHATSNATSISQWASLAALKTPAELLTQQLEIFEERRDKIYQGLLSVKGWETTKPQGAFYIFPNVEGWFGLSSASGEINDAMDVCNYLLEDAGLAVVPGSPFGAPDHVRLSFALATERLEEGLERLHEACSKLS